MEQTVEGMEQIMEDDVSQKFIADATGPTVTVLLHPLVILNISEHWTRICAQEGTDNQVAGALIGKFKEDRVIEIMNSFELVSKVSDNDTMLVNLSIYYQKEELFKQVFPDLVFLGWYITGTATPTKTDVKNHKHMGRIYEHCLLLKLDPHDSFKDFLPITLYESVMTQELDTNGEPKMLFVKVDYTLAVDEAEWIGVNHMAETASSESSKSSALVKVLNVQYNATEMLYKRVKMLLEYVKAVQNKELPQDNIILREIFTLTRRLPVMHQSPKLKAEFYAQYIDVALITYLGLMTKSCNNVNQFFQKFSILNEKRFGYSPLSLGSGSRHIPRIFCKRIDDLSFPDDKPGPSKRP